jgi:hypothetical protein
MRHSYHRCYHHNGMRAQKIGQVLGIGVRVAGRMAGQRMTASAQNTEVSAAETVSKAQAVGERAARDGRAAGRATKGVVRGMGGFLRPFRRVGGILWLEITGAFFLLPVVVFAPKLWSVRASWAHGPDHRLFVVTAGVMVVFLYLGISSFWRAWKQ